MLGSLEASGLRGCELFEAKEEADEEDGEVGEEDKEKEEEDEEEEEDSLAGASPRLDVLETLSLLALGKKSVGAFDNGIVFACTSVLFHSVGAISKRRSDSSDIRRACRQLGI